MSCLKQKRRFRAHVTCLKPPYEGIASGASSDVLDIGLASSDSRSSSLSSSGHHQTCRPSLVLPSHMNKFYPFKKSILFKPSLSHCKVQYRGQITVIWVYLLRLFSRPNNLPHIRVSATRTEGQLPDRYDLAICFHIRRDPYRWV